MMVVRKLQGKKRCYIIVFFFSFLHDTPFILPYLFTLVLRSYYFFNSFFYYDSKPYRSIIFIISHFSEFTVILLIFACIHIHIFWHLNGDFWICRCGSIRVEWNKKKRDVYATTSAFVCHSIHYNGLFYGWKDFFLHA